MLISTLNCKMWPNFSYRGVRSVQLLLLLLLLMVFSSENFGFSLPYAGIAGIGPAHRYFSHNQIPPSALLKRNITAPNSYELNVDLKK